MEKQEFKTMIYASPEKVWEVLWGEDSYRSWTAAFMEGSYAKTEGWKKGSKVLFLDGNNDGILSTVAENIPNSFMSFRHLGSVKGGVEDISTAEAAGWSGAMESYTLRPEDGKTELTVNMDVDETYAEYFKQTWPKALEKIKSLAEN